MKIRKISPLMVAAATMVASVLPIQAIAQQAAQQTAEQIIKNNCLACHTEESAGPQWSRMSHQRKSPEGWLMTIGRMQVMHGLKINDDDRRTLVKYFSDRQGLAPEESQNYRYAMERRLNTQEVNESDAMAQMCSRCHTEARVMLQRRPATEWEHLVHFHLGQWPTVEYQAMGRDRDWLGTALNTMVPKLAKLLPLETKAWSQWQKAIKPVITGEWRFSGNMPGKGALEGTMAISGSDAEGYQLNLAGNYADGSAFKGRGQGVVYTGYEWRANVNIGGIKMRQVLAASKDGTQLEGRMFEVLHDEIGMDLSATKNTGITNQVLAVQPGHIKAGTTQQLTIVGNNLSDSPLDKLDLGKGIKVAKVLSSSSQRLVVEAVAKSDAPLGSRSIKLGGNKGAELNVYDRVSTVQVVPAFAVSRVGGNGGSSAKVTAAFLAEGWAPGKDGKAGTQDDQRIGFLPASWSVAPFDQVAETDKDTHFSGRMDAVKGVFTPALAGPNPDRRMSTNNAGNLKVVAQLNDAGQAISGEGQMIVTIQRWNNPPLP